MWPIFCHIKHRRPSTHAHSVLGPGCGRPTGLCGALPQGSQARRTAFAPLAPGSEWESGGASILPWNPAALCLPRAPCHLWSLRAHSLRYAGIARDQTVEKGVPLIGLRQPDKLLRLPSPLWGALIGGTHAALRKLVFVAPSGCQNKPERFIPNRKLSEKPDSFTGNKSLRGWYILSTFSFHS